MLIGWNRRFGHAKELLRPWYLRNVYFRAFPERRPPFFDRAWTYPHQPLASIGVGENHAAQGSVGRERCDFLFLPMSDLHFRLQRPHLLMRALAARGHRCFLLNPHLGRQFLRRTDVSPQVATIAPNQFELHIRLPLEPVYHHRLLHPEESALIAETVDEVRRRMGTGRLLQVICSPVWWQAASLIREHSGAPVIYDCHDLIAGFSSTHPAISNEEGPLICGSDFVACSSTALREHCLNSGAVPGRCSVIRNGVTTHDPTSGRSPVAGRQGGIRIGYLGALEDWFDADSIRVAAESRPDWTFVLGGRIESERVKTLARLPNVELPGEIPRDRVVEFLASLDVATIPFLLNNLTRAVDPIKLYEYLDAGLAVVTSRLPETLRFASLLCYYDAPADFVAAVESALAGRSVERALLRRAAVKNETWDARAEQLLGCVRAIAI